MNRRVWVLATLLLVAGGCARPPTKPVSDSQNAGTASPPNKPVSGSLEYDGIYRGPARQVSDGVIYTDYLRFYPDGEVVEAASPGQPQEIRRWFSRETSNLSLGKFTVQGNHISFSVGRAGGGIVDFTGVIESGQLHLDAYSHVSGNRTHRVYSFVKW
jgi:hypothetical protein